MIGPRITDSITVLSGSESMITSQAPASEARLPAGVAPQAGILAGSVSTARMSYPASIIRRVIRPPMLPAPTMPAGPVTRLPADPAGPPGPGLADPPGPPGPGV